jgi:hypothetical protein
MVLHLATLKSIRAKWIETSMFEFALIVGGYHLGWKNNLLQWARSPQVCWPRKFLHNPSIRNPCFWFICSFPPHVTKSHLTHFLHFLHLGPHLLSLCFYILYLLLIYLAFPLLLSFLHSVFAFFYTFSLYYSPVSSSISPLISSPSCYPAATLSLYRVTSKWMMSKFSFLITRSSIEQLFRRTWVPGTNKQTGRC